MTVTTDNGKRWAWCQGGIGQAARQLLVQAAASRQRRVLLLAGARDWVRAGADEILAAVGQPVESAWLGAEAPAGMTAVVAGKVSRLLGQELRLLVVDAYAGFDPDAVGAAIGALVGGGLLVLLTPPLARWERYPDPEHARIAVAPHGPEAVTGRFLRRLARLLAEAPPEEVYRVEQDRPLPPLPGTLAAPPPAALPPYASEEQRQAVEVLLRVATGRVRRPVVLIADRGRGKSAALGLAAARLLAAGTMRIALTGPRLEAVRAVFEHAVRQLPQARLRPGQLESGQGKLWFVPPDALASERPAADLLLVDEAAAIPVPLLLRLLQHYPRVAFTTTVHGYEGTGRGFLLRFLRALAARTPERRLLRLETPVRWAPHDPLERLSFRLLLLDAEAAPDRAAAAARPDSIRLEWLDRDALVEDEALLSELFGLLLQAHYRTRPFDLRHLLDGPNVEILVQRQGPHVVGAALLALEGGLQPALAAAVQRGERRLRGHLLPQSLAFHLGLAEGAALRCVRIMRLAVHPACRQRGLGRSLLAAVAARAKAGGWDAVGSSFGGDAELLRFWQRCGFQPVRVGMTRGSRSGEHALLVLQALSPLGQSLLASARRQFLRDLPAQLAQPLRDLDPELAVLLLPDDATAAALDADDCRQLVAFAHGRRSYGDSLGALQRLVLAAGAALAGLSAAQRRLLLAKVMQGRDWSEVAELGSWPGRAAAEEALRQAVRQLLQQGGLSPPANGFPGASMV